MTVSVLAAVALAAIQATTECVGCHTPARDAPSSRFESGLGRWTETQCVGCHHEINEVVREGVLFGRRGASYMALPLSEERRAGLVAIPLSFTSGPEDVGLTAGSFLRIDSERLLDFLRRPVDVRRAPGETDRMMAFPSLTWNDVPDVVRVMATRPRLVSTGTCEMPARAAGAESASAPSSSAIAGAREAWARCKPCHESATAASGRPPSYLALFTPEWIYAYANGLAARPEAGERAMPTVPITRAAAEGLYAFFGERKAEDERRLDARVLHMDTAAVEARTKNRALTEEERSFVWTKLLREGKCVHCHGAEGHRAFQKFAGTSWALARYVGEHGGMAIWRRLETRAFEAEAGLTASAPGMPMASEPLPQDTRDLIYVWARDGCPSPSGRLECAPVRTSSTTRRGRRRGDQP